MCSLDQKIELLSTCIAPYMYAHLACVVCQAVMGLYVLRASSYVCSTCRQAVRCVLAIVPYACGGG